MPEHKERVGVFFREDVELHVALERAAQIDELSFAVVWLRNTSNQRGIGEARRDTARDVRRRGALGDILDAAVRQCDVNLLHGDLLDEKRNTKLIGGFPLGQDDARAEPLSDERCLRPTRFLELPLGPCEITQR